MEPIQKMTSRGIEKKIKGAVRCILSTSCHIAGYSLAKLKSRIAILMYHRVVTEKDLKESYIQPGMYVLKEVFESQTRFLKDYFEIITFAELLDLFKKEKWDKEKRYCLITFDDGWLDNYRYAYPVLKKNRIPATIFLPTALIGTDEWFWPEKIGYLLRHFCKVKIRRERLGSLLRKYEWLANIDRDARGEGIDKAIERCKELRDEEIQRCVTDLAKTGDIILPKKRLLLNWEEIFTMSQSGISFGSHSCSHAILTGVPLTQAKKEIEDSMSILQGHGINHVPVFCYPNGNYNPEIVHLVKKAGYQAAVTTVTGVEQCNSGSKNLFELKRIGIHNDMSRTIPLLAYRLSRCS